MKKILLCLACVIIAVIAFGAWFSSLLEDDAARAALADTQPRDLHYLSQRPEQTRGKILAVITSTDTLGKTGKYTGYELTELARAYYVFIANGFDVDIASPHGGKPPVVIDGDDMGAFDYAFLNDAQAQKKTTDTIPVSEVDADAYRAIYFVGGKGAMFDFPDNKAIQSLVRDMYEAGKTIGAVCHGPAALVNVTLADGRALVAGKSVSGFTNEEELLLIPDAGEIFPFLLQNKLTARGANFNAGPMYLETISEDGNLITGQNPWSVWTLAESMVRQLGYAPVEREVTAEENSVAVLLTYETQGYDRAKAHLTSLLNEHSAGVDRNLIAIHSLVAAMQWRIDKVFHMLGLARQAKNSRAE